MKNIQNLLVRRVIAIIIIISMIITTSGFNVFADSISDIVDATNGEITNQAGVSHNYYEENMVEEEIETNYDTIEENEVEKEDANEIEELEYDIDDESEENISVNDEIVNDEIENGETENDEVENDEVENGEVENDEIVNDEIENGETENDEIKNGEIENDEVENDEVENGEDESDEIETKNSKLIEEQEENIIDSLIENDETKNNDSDEIENYENTIATNNDVEMYDREEVATLSENSEDEITNENNEFDLSTFSEIDDIIFATLSELQNDNIASTSELQDTNIASTSELIEISLASISTIKIASDSKIFGDGNTSTEYIWLGTYPQSSTDYDVVEPIKWVVLNDDNNQKYLLSEKILTHRPIAPANDFAASPLKDWLNGDFYNKAFEAFEKSAITDTHITDAGDTTCKIYLLSRNEHNNYNVRSYNVNSKAPKTTYSGDASGLIASTNPYWLRYRDSYGNKYYINADGEFDSTQDWSGTVSYGVRPTMNVDVTDELLNANESNVTWQLGEDASFIADSTWTEWNKYREGYEQKLPTTGNFSTKPDGKELIGWIINDGLNIIATYSIPSNMRGDITLKPIWGVSGQKFIIYDLHNDTNGENGIFLTEPPFSYVPGTALSLPDPSIVTDPSGNVATGWKINGVDVTEIPSTETSDVHVKAVFGADTGYSKLSFDLGVGRFVTGFSTPSEYQRGVSFPLPSSTSIVTPETYSFSHWMLKDIYGNVINENATEISSTQTGYIKVVAVYKNATYNINWELGSDVSFKPSYIASTSYTYNVGLTLPDASVLNLPAGKGFLGWNIRQAGKPDILDALVIEPSSIGDVTIVAHYDDEYFSINWDLGQGYFISGFATPSSYRAGSGQALPASDKVVSASIKLFDHWEINDVETTSIPVTSQGTITIVAKYKYDDMWFGTYPQNDTSGNQYEPIRWKIITQNENEALLIPEKIIDDQAYNNSTGITWENCSIRSWLNNTFITGAFTSNQISVILEKTIHTTGAPTYPDSNTLEKVFLLSTSEIDGYSGIMGSGTAQATPYAKNGSTLKVRDGNSPYWLRNLYSSNEAYMVDYNGYLQRPYAPVYNKFYGGVRPVFYINLQSPTFQNTSNNVSWNGDNLFNQESILWESFDKYFGGQKLPTAENMRDRSGSTFLGWRINNSTTIYDEIPMTQTGDITLTPVWVAPVTWRLGANATLSEVSLATPSYTIGTGFDLPDSSKVISARTFDHWAIVQNGVIIDDNVTRISEDIEGPIEIVAIYTDSEYTISWNMGPLSFVSDYIASTSYLYGVGYSLPDVSKINLPPGYEFNYWIKKQTGAPDITHATNITIEDYGDVEIVAKYTQVFWFGTYPQNDSTGTELEPIKWNVLTKNANEALLIADSIIDSVPYHSELESTTWQASSIRSWLDTTFKTKAFTENQINSGIVSKSISTDGNNTIDQIFLLSRYNSEDENAPYFTYDEEKKATASTYAKTINPNLNVVDGYSPWWLRSRGGSADRGTYIDEGGQLRAGETVDSDFVGVRPVLYINLQSSTIKTDNNRITFNLNGASWKDNSKLWQEMDRYQGGQKLPTLSNLNMPKRKIFTGWTLSDDPDNIITEIPVGQTGDIVLEANFIDCYDIFFGTYPQSVTWQNDGSTYDVVEPIKWNMLSYNGSEAFLISDKILDNVTYDSSHHAWSGSHMRYWLFSIFYDKAFSFDEERAGVKTTRVKTPDSPDTDDDVFLLSKDEAENELYFSGNDERKAAGTQYAKTVVNDSHTLDVDSNGCSYYWLRQAPGGTGGNSIIYVVQPDGQILPEQVTNKNFGVRPAITVDLSSPIFNATESEINWQIGSDASFLSESTWTEFTKYREGFVNKLPTDGNFATRPDGKVLIGWLIDNGLYKVATYSIPETTKGDISVKPIWGTAGQKLINYDLYIATTSEYGRFLSEPPYVYTPGETFTLPDVSTVEDPSGRIAFSWQINGVDVTEIASTSTTDVEVKAIFNDTGTYKIEFDMGDGHLTIATPTEYTHGVELPLPASTSVVAPYGREFSHWMLKGANGNIISENTATISDTQRGYIKVVAVYNILSYNITWNLGSGRFINSFATPSTYQYGTGLKLPASTSIIPPIGYEFNYWEIGGVATTSITKTDYGNKHVVAIYNLSTYHINWNLDDGTTGNHGEWDGTAGATSYTYETEYLLPTNIIGPTGRIFTNWEIEGIATTSIPVGSTGDKEFNAKYRNATYSVTWHDLDGNDINWISGFTATTSYTYSEGMALPSTESIVLPMRMEFDYWIIRRAGETDIEYATSIAPSLTGDVDIIAVYKYVTYTINYDTVILDVEIDNNNVERIYNSADTLLSTPSKTNYKFVGWYRNYNATTHEYTNLYTGNDDIYVDGMSTYTIYAKWQVILTYNVNGHGSLSPNYEYVDLWDTTTLPTLSDVTGYTFDLTNSWYDDVDTSTATLIGSAGSIFTVTEPKVLFAHWDENIYNVTYHMNGGTWKVGAHNKSTRSYTERLTLPTSDDIEKVIGTDTYEFDGWWTMDGSTSHYWGDKVEFIAENTTEDKELYAKWNSTISFNTLGHGTQPESIEINGTLDVTLSSISEIGWTFDGWYSSATEFTVNNFIGYGGEIITFNGPKILYAKWIENSYKIILHVNGGIFNEGYTEWTLNPTTGNYEANRLYHESIILPTNSNITKDGFTFDGWYDNINLTGTKITSVEANTNSEKEFWLKWNGIPTPTPTPTPTPSGGNGGSGGSGGGNGGGSSSVGPMIEQTNYINQIKTINAIIDSSQVSWVYDLATDKFKMNISVGDIVVPAINGCYLVNKVVEQNINGVIINDIVNSTYYFDDKGNMMTGWIKTIDDKWYYTRSEKDINEGQMVFGWYKVQSKWYYFATDGSMLANSMTPDGYFVGTDGAWIQ